MSKEKLFGNLAKATVCVSGSFGVSQIKVLDLTVEIGPYAQYDKAYHLTYKLPRKRKFTGLVRYGNAMIVVLSGHCDIPTPDVFEARDGGKITRFGSFDPRYVAEFREALKSFLVEKGSELCVLDTAQV